MYLNRTYERVGPVFQNRFKSILIESDAYFLKLSQYIYLNPVKAGLAADPRKYQYSSIREALGKEPLYILDRDIIRLIGETKKSQETYEQFILDGIGEDHADIAKLFEQEEATFGTSRFSTLAQKKYLRRKYKTIKHMD